MIMTHNGIVNFSFERATVTHPWIYWDDWYNNEEIQKIIEQCQSVDVEKAVTIGGEDHDYRRSKVRWIYPNTQTNWFFEKTNSLIEMLNNRFYGFDLNGYESFQYTEYEASEKGHYDWHMDTHMGYKDGPIDRDFIQPRKLSLTIMLNDDYEGGEFQLNTQGEYNPKSPERKVGRVIAFPSFIMHRVTPVTSGTRKSIVVWVTGPKFR